jgi:hypothetical protein
MVTQEGRRTEVAREGVDHHATALSHARPAARALEPATPARADAPRGFGGASGPTIYRTPPPASTTAPLLAAGGLLALFAAAAGRAAGIRRRRARAASRRWLR